MNVLLIHPVFRGLQHERRYRPVFAVWLTFSRQQKTRCQAGSLTDLCQEVLQHHLVLGGCAMSHPENTTAPSSAQQVTLNQMEFGDPQLLGTRLFSIQEGVDLLDGLRYAADIGEGVHQLANRLAASINEGDLAYLAEVRALALLAEISSTLARASQYAMQRAGERP
ncbi:hypothetical protein [Pseudomonas sp. URMO17WK12:I11]|uniref:hypothetical protein n=1 Tax=Pseudomonas sp. URMO17WK12:I11 TaxID=1283291 RepID=UPI0015B5B068|nr:hypothetical protein [Pseudomonas sp. URMO17WK12:I11]